MNSSNNQADFYLHDACILVDTYYEAVAKIFQSISYLESTFFRLLYETNYSQAIESKSDSYFPVSSLEGLSMEIDGIAVNQLELSIFQEGATHKLAYYHIINEKKHVRLDKTYQILKLDSKQGYLNLKIYIKEKGYLAEGCLINKKPTVQYEITFVIRELENSVLVYFKIEIHPLLQIPSPYNKSFRNKFQYNIAEACKNEKFRCNYENTESIIINSTKHIIFHLIANPTTYRDKDSVLEVEENKGNLKVGDQFSFTILPLQVKLKFEVIKHEFEASDSSDCFFSCQMLSSEPEHVKFSFTFTIKSLNQHCHLLSLHNVFDQALFPDFMKQHSKYKKATLKSFKTQAEMVYLNSSCNK